MSEMNIHVPVVATRGIIVFPGQDVMIEVGRQKSLAAVSLSSQSFDSMVWIVCQNDIMVDDPKEANLYKVGTMSKIKVIRKKGEESKVAIRAIRRDTNEQIKKDKKESVITEDDQKDLEEKAQKLTDDVIKQIDKIIADKEKEIMAV